MAKAKDHRYPHGEKGDCKLCCQLLEEEAREIMAHSEVWKATINLAVESGATK